MGYFVSYLQHPLETFSWEFFSGEFLIMILRNMTHVNLMVSHIFLSACVLFTKFNLSHGCFVRLISIAFAIYSNALIA